MPDPSQFDNCRKNMIDASFDDRNEVFVYTDTSHNMEVLKLDEYTKEFEVYSQEDVKLCLANRLFVFHLI